MAKNKKVKRETDGIVYSTEANYAFADLFEQMGLPLENKANSKQQLYLSLDKKHRGGKMVTLVEGFKGTEEAGEELSKELKSLCGTGGGFKEGDILVQGDHRDKVFKILLNKGFIVKKKGG